MAINLAHIGQGHYLEPSAARAFLIAQQSAGFGFPLTSGFRTVSQQARLYKQKKGKVPVAPPGKSKHNFGLAVDIDTNRGQQAIAWMRRYGPRFGWYPIKSESWHFEYRGPQRQMARRPTQPQAGGNIGQRAVVYAAQRMGIPQQELPYLMRLIQKESGFRVGVKNPKSSATGLGQLLRSNWGYMPGGARGIGNPVAEAVGAIRYVQKRYGTPSRALSFHNQKGWY